MENTDRIKEETALDRQLEPVLIGAGGFAREIVAEVFLQTKNATKMFCR